MDIKIEDFEGDISLDDMPPIPGKIIEYLGGLNDGKLVTIERLASDLEISEGSIVHYARFYKDKYSILRRMKGTRRRLYGNEATIKYVKEQGW